MNQIEQQNEPGSSFAQKVDWMELLLYWHRRSGDADNSWNPLSAGWGDDTFYRTPVDARISDSGAEEVRKMLASKGPNPPHSPKDLLLSETAGTTEFSGLIDHGLESSNRNGDQHSNASWLGVGHIAHRYFCAFARTDLAVLRHYI